MRLCGKEWWGRKLYLGSVGTAECAGAGTVRELRKLSGFHELSAVAAFYYCFLFLSLERIGIRVAGVALGKGDRKDSLSTPGSEMLVTDGGEGGEW